MKTNFTTSTTEIILHSNNLLVKNSKVRRTALKYQKVDQKASEETRKQKNRNADGKHFLVPLCKQKITDVKKKKKKKIIGILPH